MWRRNGLIKGAGDRLDEAKELGLIGLMGSFGKSEKEPGLIQLMYKKDLILLTEGAELTIKFRPPLLTCGKREASKETAADIIGTRNNAQHVCRAQRSTGEV